jgi:hypothetical protein
MPQTKQLAYGVFLPLQFRDSYVTSGRDSMTIKLPIVAIDIPDKDPRGTRKGTILTNPRDDEDAYADLSFRAYFVWSTGELQQIGLELQYYDTFSVDLSRAERMVALLRKIRKAQARLPITPCDFGQYVALLGPSVGIKYIVTPEDEETDRRANYPEGWYRISVIRDAQAYIYRLVEDLKQRHLLATLTHA